MTNQTVPNGIKNIFCQFLISFMLILSAAAGQALGGAGPDEPVQDLTVVSIEDLMHLTVTSVSKKNQELSHAAAAVFVITQEDIRRSGVTSIAEALRMVPGLEVARIDSSKWAISSRGFNGRFASKMLVLMDGRTLYTPMFSGVFWNAQDTLLEDIERIEIIRGPGATLWGANAVNGIINIITKNSEDTVGGFVSAGGGTLERMFGSARYGTNISNFSSLRFYLKYMDRAGLNNPQTGREEHNRWNNLHGGFRLDSEVTASDTLTLEGNYYDSRLEETYLNIPPGNSSFNYTTPVSGGNALTRWKRTFSDTADLALQLYYDRTEVRYAVIGEQRDTIDLDFQNRFSPGTGQDIIWGAGYRLTRDRLSFPSSSLGLTPGSKTDTILNAFVQGNFTLVPERLHLIVGSKFEHNDYSGFEIQPTGRLLWTPAPKHSVWVSISRAVRTPSRGEDSLSLMVPGSPVSIPGFSQPFASQLHLMGSSSMKAEELVAYEVGYRVQPIESASIDVAAFYNVYRQLAIYKSGQPVPDFTTPQPTVTIPMQLGNFGRAETMGVELATNVRALPWWGLKMAYTFLQLVRKEAEPGVVFSDIKRENPQHQVSVRSMMDLTKEVELDLWLRYIDALPAFNVGSYLTMDARLAWRPFRDLELALIGQNLFHDRQQEFIPQFISTQPAAFGRSLYGKISLKF